MRSRPGERVPRFRMLPPAGRCAEATCHRRDYRVPFDTCPASCCAADCPDIQAGPKPDAAERDRIRALRIARVGGFDCRQSHGPVPRADGAALSQLPPHARHPSRKLLNPPMRLCRHGCPHVRRIKTRAKGASMGSLPCCFLCRFALAAPRQTGGGTAAVQRRTLALYAPTGCKIVRGVVCTSARSRPAGQRRRALTLPSLSIVCRTTT